MKAVIGGSAGVCKFKCIEDYPTSQRSLSVSDTEVSESQDNMMDTHDGDRFTIDTAFGLGESPFTRLGVKFALRDSMLENLHFVIS
jgi:hypothetical protein